MAEIEIDSRISVGKHEDVRRWVDSFLNAATARGMPVSKVNVVRRRAGVYGLRMTDGRRTTEMDAMFREKENATGAGRGFARWFREGGIDREMDVVEGEEKPQVAILAAALWRSTGQDGASFAGQIAMSTTKWVRPGTHVGRKYQRRDLDGGIWLRIPECWHATADGLRIHGVPKLSLGFRGEGWTLDGRDLVVMGGRLPETLVGALAGEKAGDAIDIPAFADGQAAIRSAANDGDDLRIVLDLPTITLGEAIGMIDA